jgi:hypothetical protein
VAWSFAFAAGSAGVLDSFGPSDVAALGLGGLGLVRGELSACGVDGFGLPPCDRTPILCCFLVLPGLLELPR